MQRQSLSRPFVPVALAGAASLALLGGAVAQEATPATTTIEAVEARLVDAQGNEVGTVSLDEVVTEGVQVGIDIVAGEIAPGRHPVRILEQGICDLATTDEAAVAHDLGTIDVADDGSVAVVIPTDGFTLEELDDEDGAALVVGAATEDQPTDPDGEEPAPVGCAVVFPPRIGATPTAATPGSDDPEAEAIATALAEDLVEPGPPDALVASPEAED